MTNKEQQYFEVMLEQILQPLQKGTVRLMARLNVITANPKKITNCRWI
jgi:hypothetical protein